MSWVDAFLHMCSTVSLGGFSNYDVSIGHWNSAQIEAVAIVFMLLSGINLVMYFGATPKFEPSISRCPRALP